MTDFYVYDSATGAIKRAGSAPEEMVDIQAQVGERVTVGTCDQVTQYVVVDAEQANDVLTDKVALPVTISGTTIAADGVATISITGSIGTATIRLSGPHADQWQDSDGTIEWATELPGTYTMTITSDQPQYLPLTLTITAT